MAKTITKDAPEDLKQSVKSGAVETGAGAPTMDVTSLLGDAASDRLERPNMAPPNEIETEDRDIGLTAWHNSKKITAMWTNASTRNVHAMVNGLGWRRLSNANDSAHLTLVMLATHAEQTNATVNVEVGSDNEIHQIYVW